MTMFFQVAIDGLLSGMVYALVASGLSLIWGVMDVINFAHGEFLMVAMYVITYRLIIRQCLGGPALSALLATFGLSMILKNICLNRFSPNFRLLTGTLLDGKKIIVGKVIFPLPQLVTGLFALAVVFIIYYIIKRTRLGWAIQATAMDKEAAELMGLGGACVGIAGGLMPSYLAVHPEVGGLFSLIAFIAVAMGGFGSIPGALLAALFIGLVEAFGGFYIAPVFKYVVVFGLYIAVVMFRPKGLFGW